MAIGHCDLDGNPSDFPARDEAMAEYRVLWMSFLFCSNDDARDELAKRMDEVQDAICVGPGPLWKSFAATLPGFMPFWQRFGPEAAELHRF